MFLRPFLAVFLMLGASAACSAESAGVLVLDAAVDACATPISPGEERTCTLTVGGVAREFLLYAPSTYDPHAPAGLVVDAHGSNETDAQQSGTAPFFDWPQGLGSGFRLVADREGFLVATPQGVNKLWTSADVAFALAIPAAVGAHVQVDPARTFMTGISLGGALTYWTGCADAGVFRGFAPVSATDETGCTPSHPASIIHFQSPDDPVAKFDDAKATFQRWVTASHCEGPAASWTFGAGSTDTRALCLNAGPPWQLVPCDPSAPATTCERWTGCDGGTSAMFCTVPGDASWGLGVSGGHVLYFNATHLSLAAVTWAFLAP